MAKTNGENLDVAVKTQKKTLAGMLEQMKPEIEKALPSLIDKDRFTRIALTAYNSNPRLANVDHISFIAAVMTSAQLGLEPNTPLGQAYLIPYGTKCQFQIGYQGALSLAYRTGLYASIYAHEVYAEDTFNYQLGTNKLIHHVPSENRNEKSEPTHYYAVYKLVNGGFDFVVWTIKQVRVHANQFSEALKGGRQTPWKTNFDSMAKKTVLLDALKYAPKTAEFERSYALDYSVKNSLSSDMDSVVDVEMLASEDMINDLIALADEKGLDYDELCAKMVYYFHKETLEQLTDNEITKAIQLLQATEM